MDYLAITYLIVSYIVGAKVVRGCEREDTRTDWFHYDDPSPVRRMTYLFIWMFSPAWIPFYIAQFVLFVKLGD